jgi:hypothetical protein
VTNGRNSKHRTTTPAPPIPSSLQRTLEQNSQRKVTPTSKGSDTATKAEEKLSYTRRSGGEAERRQARRKWSRHRGKEDLMTGYTVGSMVEARVEAVAEASLFRPARGVDLMTGYTVGSMVEARVEVVAEACLAGGGGGFGSRREDPMVTSPPELVRMI